MENISRIINVNLIEEEDDSDWDYLLRSEYHNSQKDGILFTNLLKTPPSNDAINFQLKKSSFDDIRGY
jgi:hypothetical protein